MDLASGEKEKCPECSGGKWVILYPMNVAASCPRCSAGRPLIEILNERGVRLVVDQWGRWSEMLLQ